ncbi:beta-ketoacyl synthase N-terminal-like domain-containing protein [Amycolatopsis aidingensis]|uniref:beta-ketoacyl synthase N-terminal-like domain-containing protein n=1 Tax=Amycolatopsis aidingensis TaxID=2842453 RepID=UPI001C0E1163|nr:beta-ketoacyl synthase N-terminal-like domain-containing protein [Amycolatopsis aidingensis]
MTVPIGGFGALSSPPRPDGWFDPAAHLGRRGWKYLTPATRFLLAAANLALGRQQGDPAASGQDSTGLGVFTGTHQCITGLHEKLYRTIRQEGVGELSPVELPGFAANIPATQLAITLGARACAVTLTNPVTGGLEGVLLGAQAIRRGRAARVLATAAEQAAPGAPGEGAGVLVLGGAVDRPQGTVLGGVSRFLPDPGGPALPADLGVELAASLAGVGPVRVVACGPARTAPLADALGTELAGSGVPIAGTDYTEARHGTVSPLLTMGALLERPGAAVVLAASGRGHLCALALRSH